jgi:hypothetical protein
MEEVTNTESADAEPFKMPGLPAAPLPVKSPKVMKKNTEPDEPAPPVAADDKSVADSDNEALSGQVSNKKLPTLPGESLGTSNLKVSPAEMAKANQTPLPYQEPSWGGIPTQRYALEVIKNGSVLETFPLQDKSFFVVGRLANCDIVLEHPSLSRSIISMNVYVVALINFETRPKTCLKDNTLPVPVLRLSFLFLFFVDFGCEQIFESFVNGYRYCPIRLARDPDSDPKKRNSK